MNYGSTLQNVGDNQVVMMILRDGTRIAGLNPANTYVISVRKSDLDAATQNRISREEAARRISVLKF
ncbi:MAG: hypothetical protein LAT57_09050 [Balneolales bacterium]|nr:hypothetical protein [Balneolales bacterium]